MKLADSPLLGLFLSFLPLALAHNGFADRLARTLGRNGMTVVTKLSSFLLVCIGVQIGWNGIKDLLESVVLHVA